MMIDTQAGPGIDGSVGLLCRGQLWRLPVGESLTLRDLPTKEEGIYLLQAVIFDTELVDEELQINKILRFAYRTLPDGCKVVAQGEPDFFDVGIAHQLFQEIGITNHVEPEEITTLLRGQLHQCYLVVLSPFECRLGLGVETDGLVPGEICHRLCHLLIVIYYNYLAVEPLCRQLGQLLFGNRQSHNSSMLY
ncbi:MAG: hypothetical protein JG761_1248 [Proteiniphilum sp.]|nr:hypothetical protein [Proteiniphilum sp.]